MSFTNKVKVALPCKRHLYAITKGAVIGLPQFARKLRLYEFFIGAAELRNYLLLHEIFLRSCEIITILSLFLTACNKKLRFRRNFHLHAIKGAVTFGHTTSTKLKQLCGKARLYAIFCSYRCILHAIFTKIKFFSYSYKQFDKTNVNNIFIL